MLLTQINHSFRIKILGTIILSLLVCSPAEAQQSRVATPSRTNAKAPAVKAPAVKAPAVKAPVAVRTTTTAAVTRSTTISPVVAPKPVVAPVATTAVIARSTATVAPLPPSSNQIAKALAGLADGTITAANFTAILAGGAAPTEGQPATSPVIPELTRLTIEAANQALAQIPGPRVAMYTGALKFVSTDWSALLQRAGNSQSTRSMLEQFKEMANQPAFQNVSNYKRPTIMAEIPSELKDGRLANVALAKRETFALAMVDCSQTSWLSSNGVLLALTAKYTQNPEQLSRAVNMLEEVNKYVPLQRQGTTIWEPNVVMPEGGDGVWLATAWGISAIVDISTILGDSVPVELRDRLRLQLREEVKRICQDWRDRRPWFVKSRCAVSNQWIEPSIGLIKACLFLGDPLLLPAYNLGVENLLASLQSHGQNGEFLEGFSYAQMSLLPIHEIIGKMRLAGDSRCISVPFVKNNWKWFAQMHQPGKMLVNCGDSGLSELPDYCYTVPFSSFSAAAMASGDPDAQAMMRFLYPNPKPIGALEALKYADYLLENGGTGQVSLPTFAYFPSQQLVTWRTEFQPIASVQTALSIWAKGGTLKENHVHREQGHLSIYNGDRIVLMNCGTPFYNDPNYVSGFASSAGSNIMQVDQLAPSGMAVSAPLAVNRLDANGGNISIDSSGAYLGATCTRNISWDQTGLVKIVDQANLSSAVPSGTEFYRFHTGSAESLNITGSGKLWNVTWRGTTMKITSDKPIEVIQITSPDKVTAPFQHQTILINVQQQTNSLVLTSELIIDRSITQ
jgi:Heparinase II/III-like protein